jgi:hypothetical protein
MTDESQQNRDQELEFLALDITHAIHEALRKGKRTNRHLRTDQFLSDSDIANDILKRVSNRLRTSMKFPVTTEHSAALEMIANRLSPEKA